MSELDDLLLGAFQRGALDVHIELEAATCCVRERRSEGMVTVWRGDHSAGRRLLAALQAQAGLRFEEDGDAQDGRIVRRDVEYRISWLPTAHGLSVVLRILPRALKAVVADFFAGQDGAEQRAFERAIRQPDGWILVCGPTGSGKTTTLYQLLSMADVSGRKVITVEDPVERWMPGIVQTEVDAAVGWTYHSALRRLLRHDPDVILVGELRDAESAATAMHAAMTGHLILSTVHAADAAGAVDRLRQLGISPRIQAEIHRMTLAQRLLPRSCRHCREPDGCGGWRAAGCFDCGYTGTAGSLRITERIEWDAAGRACLAEELPAYRLRENWRVAGTELLPQRLRTAVAHGDVNTDVLRQFESPSGE